jgi:hypothetical protein
MNETDSMTGDATLDTVAERIFREADGDRSRAYTLTYEYAGSDNRVLNKIDTIVRKKFHAADNAAKDAVVERCFHESGGDHRLGYRLAARYTEGEFDCWVSEDIRRRLIDRFAIQAESAFTGHPFGDQEVRVSHAHDENGDLYDVGIRADGSLINPRNYAEGRVRRALRIATAREIEAKIERTARAAETRARRSSKLIYEVAAGIRAGKAYGPRDFCLLCKRQLTDPTSVRRGIGPECMDGVLSTIEDIKDREGQPGLQRYGLSVGVPERE